MILKETTISQWAAVAAVTIFACIFAIEQIYNYDLWWHLRSGEWILENGSIPYLDPFTFSSEGTPWINTGWLGGVVFALINRLGGLDSLIIFKAVLIGLSFGGACLYLIRQGVNPYLAVLVLGYAIVVARFRFLLRPLVFMFPFALVLFWVLAGPATRKEKAAFLLAPLTVLWANLHGSVYLAPMFTGFLLCENALNYLVLRWKDAATTVFPMFGLLLAASVGAAILLTPYGFDALRYVFDVLVEDDILTGDFRVDEHQPLVWTDYKLYSVLFGVTAVSFLANWRKTRLFFLLVFIATAWMSINNVRFVGLAALLQAILLCLNLQAIFQRLQWSYKGPAWRFRHLLFLPATLLGAILTFQSTFPPQMEYQWGLGVNSSRFPVGAVNFLREMGFHGNLFNAWGEGGYLLWHLPESRNFIDGRGLRAQFKLHSWVSRSPRQELIDYMEQNDVRGVLLPKTETDLVTIFKISSQYSLGYFDEKYLVYLRQDVLAESPAAGSVLEFQYIQLQGYDFAYLEPLARGVNAGEVEQELRQALAASPDNFPLVFQLAFFLDVQNRPEAVNYYLQAARINPALGFSHFNLDIYGGRAALRHSEWLKAIEILTVAVDNGRDTPETYFMLGTSQYQLKDYAAAEKSLSQALKSDAENISALLNLAFVYVDAGKLVEAENAFAEIVELNPGNEAGRYGYALALHKSANPLALKAWQDFVNDFPESQRTASVEKYIEQLGAGVE